MKKVLLTLLTLFAVGGAWADEVTVTDLTQYDDVVYFPETTVLKGTESVSIPINIKAHAIFVAYDFNISLPTGAQLLKLNDVYETRYDKDYLGFQSIVHAGNDQADGSYKIAGSIISGGTVGGIEYESKAFNAGDAEFCSVLVDVSGLEVGEYPITVKAGAQISGFYDDAEDATIAEDIVGKLIISDRVILDENSTTLPTTYESANVTVKRTINKNEWSTICLPFDMSAEQVKAAFGDDVIIEYFEDYTINGGSKPSKTASTSATSIELNFYAYDWAEDGILGNYPYLIKTTTTVSEFDLNAIAVSADEEIVSSDVKLSGKVVGSFYGTLVAGNTVPANALFLSGNNFYYSTGDTTIKGFRGYFVLNDVLADLSSASVKINVDGEATSIGGIGLQKAVEGVYDLSGRKIQIENNDLNTLQKGVYIIDGKKVTIK